jgi:hypothetical protein
VPVGEVPKYAGNPDRRAPAGDAPVPVTVRNLLTDVLSADVGVFVSGTWSFGELESVLRECWDERTCDPAVAWDPGNPAAGHCGVTSMAVSELFGGVLLLSQVIGLDGGDRGLHYWNRLAGGLEIDLTRDQFREGERLSPPSAHLPERSARARMATRYDLYASRVRKRLHHELPEGIPSGTGATSR